MPNGKPAARKGDDTAHGGELGEGPGSPNVLIGGKRAWRGKKEEEKEEKEEEGDEDENEDDDEGENENETEPKEPTEPTEPTEPEEPEEPEEGSGLDELVEKIQEQMEHVKAVLEVVSKARDLAKKEDPPPPGAPPPPDDSEEKGIEFGRSIFELVKDFKQVFAPTEPDDHDCPVAGHGTGKTKPTQKHVLVNNLPLCREGDEVEEPGGGEDEIVEGCDSVLVGDDNKVIELAEKIGGLLDFINSAKEALAPDPPPPAAPAAGPGKIKKIKKPPGATP